MTLEETLNQKAEALEQLLPKFLPKEEGYAATVIEAMHYALMGGGKRIRPLVMGEAYTMCGGTNEGLITSFEAAIEMIHTYSLVHDDLPAMDDDDLRRGRATTHKVYGEGMGILAGDALLNYAYETATHAVETVETPEEARRLFHALQILSRKAGVYGMVGGQCADLIGERGDREGKIAADNERLSGKGTEEELLYIHTHKTGALLEASLMCGAILAGAPEETVTYLEDAGRALGLAFQIRDDILDVTGDEETLGKQTGQDARNEKTTYVALHGLAAAKEEVDRLSNEAIRLLDGAYALVDEKGSCEQAGKAHAFLKDLILWMTKRTY